MKVRIAEKTDIPSLIAFNQAMALETEGKRLVDELISEGVAAVFEDRGKGFYVVAENEGGIVGGLMITYEWSDWRNAWFWWIQSVYVVPESRGGGVYRELHEFVRDLARKRPDVFGIRLYVEKENFGAQKVYERMGMEETAYLMFEEELDR
ncbi:MAG: GNAT family N-acetyltransferase [Acidobacteria bacterium]|nr:MAG: GNAT family N-acetyltransferase [Acidobacteriota bacterium]REJ97983.1 MAG: GNAT family N-acetyltransferase [Acidobacteriota bacterium]REK16726.1 MAG: GNAT family N-acetyltransferase [Acidobacteriota bacterium]REK42637.1 MAG: GNAT family N-acetyltransferase [Acidobacteriota bacterium]